MSSWTSEQCGRWARHPMGDTETGACKLRCDKGIISVANEREAVNSHHAIRLSHLWRRRSWCSSEMPWLVIR